MDMVRVVAFARCGHFDFHSARLTSEMLPALRQGFALLLRRAGLGRFAHFVSHRTHRDFLLKTKAMIHQEIGAISAPLRSASVA
jgi:hypothetical protein